MSMKLKKMSTDFCVFYTEIHQHEIEKDEHGFLCVLYRNPIYSYLVLLSTNRASRIASKCALVAYLVWVIITSARAARL